MVVGLFSLMTSLAVLSLQKAPAQASSQSAAEVLASALRQARAEAQRQGAPVGLAFPSQSGSLSTAAGYYWLRGHQKAVPSAALELTKEYPRAAIFVGFWDLDSSRPDGRQQQCPTSTGTSQRWF